MRIGIDHRPALDGLGGIAVYVRELVAALAEGFPQDRLELLGHRLRRPAGTEPVPLPAAARLHRRRVPAALLGWAARGGLGADRLLGGVDVLHATDYVPLRSSRAPLVATVHDVCFLTLPDCYEPRQRRRLERATRRLLARAGRVIVPCERVRQELAERLDVDPARVDVVAHGPRALPPAGPARLDGTYLLFVGTLQPRKNLARLLRAFDRLAAAHPDVRLVVAGGRGWRDDALRAGMAARPRVRWEGYVDAARMAALYAGATGVVVPSLGEGFGLFAIEALAAGTPLLVGAETACADVAGDAALAVDPRDEEALAAGLVRLLEDEALRARLARAGPARAAGFSWRRCAEETHAVYERAVAR
jgi:alpha-1,3-rhamnosyl/mannosyltransferase